MLQDKLYADAVNLLASLIAIPSFSREEAVTADLLAAFLAAQGVSAERLGNNVWARNRGFDPAKPTMLLNSHHDTVRPQSAYTRDPFTPTIEGDRLYGLGSNDAGASVVSLLAAFLYLNERKKLKYNLIVAITGEEEISGAGGLEAVLPHLDEVAFAIVGEPTGLRMAIAERGLMVLDCVAHGRAGHAARNEGENAIYAALPDIAWFRSFRFPKESALFGEVKMGVTMISAGVQHNIVPAECKFTVDVRVTDRYTNQEILEEVRRHVKCDVTPRSTHLKPSSIDPAHPLVQAGVALGLETYGSPTTSDQVKLSIPSVKIGPGESARSHSADEYVLLSEIRGGIDTYILLFEKLLT